MGGDFGQGMVVLVDVDADILAKGLQVPVVFQTLTLGHPPVLSAKIQVDRYLDIANVADRGVVIHSGHLIWIWGCSVKVEPSTEIKPISNDNDIISRFYLLNPESGLSAGMTLVATLMTGFLATTALNVFGYWPARCVTRNPPCDPP